MNKATLQRIYHGDVTFGKIIFDWIPNQPNIFTIELPWKNNENNISCIPQGLYNVIPNDSLEHPHTYRLLATPDRFNILIHSGNYASQVGTHKSDTLGCILVGLGMDKSVPMVTNSIKALDWMRDNIKGNFCIEVKNSEGR